LTAKRREVSEAAPLSFFLSPFGHMVKKPQKCFFAVTHGGGMVQYVRRERQGLSHHRL
jgi:hypothetical protein